MVNDIKNKHAGVWILVVAGLILESISCLQYFTSRVAIRHEAELRARTELRKAELEIEKHTVEMETAAKTLAFLAERHIDTPDSIYAATRLTVSTLRENTSMAVAYIPDYFPGKRYLEDSIFTRQIGSAEHDYTLMEWYQNGFIHDSCWWCEPYLDDSGSQTMVVSCSCPVHDPQGRVVAVVCVDMSLAYLQTVSEYLQVYPNSYYSIRSGTGQDIVPAPDTISGRKYNIFHEEIDATGWHIEIIIPEEELFADINRIGLIVFFLMLAGLVVLALILTYSARTARKLIASNEKNRRIEDELNIAGTIQMAMLPKVFPPFMDRLDLNIYGMVEPAKEVGGDLYDFYVRQDHLFFCIGDVSGKGVPAALVMAMTRSLFRSITAHDEHSASIVRKMNRALADQNSQNMFLTLFLGVMDCRTGELDYCNAGHNAPVLKTKAGWQLLEVKPNLPLGIEPSFEFTAQTVQIQRDDILFLYTDGLTEAENSKHEQYGEQRMMQTLSEMATNRPQEIVAHLQSDVKQFVNSAPQSDDLTMLTIRYQSEALVMRNDIQQIPTLAEWMEGLDIPAELNMPLNLALEEAVSNVMLYAYPEQSGQVLVECTRRYREQTEQIVFTISDSGIPFDPTQHAEADISLSAEEREIGGLGIHLVRQIMDEVRYAREENKNILTLIKNI